MNVTTCAVRSTARADQRSAFQDRCVPYSRLAPGSTRRNNDGSELVRCPRVRGECVKGGTPPFTKGNDQPELAEVRGSARGSSGCGAKRRAVSGAGPQRQGSPTHDGIQTNAPAPEPLWWSGRPDLNRRPLAPQASALPDCATSRRVALNFSLRGQRAVCRSRPSGPAPPAPPSERRGRRRPARVWARGAASGPPAGRASRSWR